MKYVFVSILFLLLCSSCEKEHEDSSLFINADVTIETRSTSDEFENACLDIERIGRNSEGCCGFEICYNGRFDKGSTYQIWAPPNPITISPEQRCVTIYSCEDISISLIRTDDWISEIICTDPLTCTSIEECCESICYDFEILGEDAQCFIFRVTLDGNEECFPNGIPIHNDGPIQLEEFSGSNGTVTQIETTENYYSFEYCRDALYLEYDFQFTIRNEYCDSFDTFEFDLFEQGQQHNQCSE